MAQLNTPDEDKVCRHMAEAHGLIVDRYGDGAVADDITCWYTPDVMDLPDDATPEQRGDYTMVRLKSGMPLLLNINIIEFVNIFTLVRHHNHEAVLRFTRGESQN